VEGTLDYMVVHSKVIAKFNQKKASTGAGAAASAGGAAASAESSPAAGIAKTAVVPVSAELTVQAEEKKNAGNAAIQKQNYNAAVRHYSDAIDLVPQGETSYVYYSNRAAAHCYLNNYESAVEDCQNSLALNSTYTKAHSRLGLAYYHLENYEKSVEAYAKCVELEPKVKSHKVNAHLLPLEKIRGSRDACLLCGVQRAFVDTLTFLLLCTHSLTHSLTHVLTSSVTQDGLVSAKAKMTESKAVSSAGAATGGGGGLDAIMKNPDMMKQAEAMMGGMGGMGGAGGPGGGGLADLLKNPQVHFIYAIIPST